MKSFLSKVFAQIPLCIFFVLTSCHVYVDGKFDELDKRLDRLENTTIASVSTQMVNITNSIPGIEQTCKDLEDYIALLKNENIAGLDSSVSELEQNLKEMKARLQEMKEYAQSLSDQSSADNGKWTEITLNTLNLYRTVQDELSTVKVNISNVTDIINGIGVTVDQKILDFSVSITAVISQTEVKMMEWVNNRFTAYYTISETNAQINNLIVENNVEINNQINALSVRITEISTTVTNLYQSVITEVINRFEGTINEIVINKINEETVNLTATINSITTKITEIENRITVINNTINTVNEQVTAINVSINQLTVLEQQLSQYITVLQQDGDTYNTQIALLQQITNDIKVQITNLNVYVENTVNELTVNINDVKVWVKATFATIEQYNIINTTIINVQAAVTLIQADIVTINNNVTNIRTEITEVHNTVNVTIQDLDKSTREWVNKRLSEYMTASEVKKAIAELELKVDNADADLAKSLDDLKARFEKTQTDQTDAIKKAVEEAIKNHDGDVSSELAALEKDIASLQSNVTYIQAELQDLYDRLKSAEEKLAIIDVLIRDVQSVKVIPTYSDGSVAVSNGTTAIQFEVLPLSAAENLVSDASTGNFSFDVMKVSTKSGSSTHPLQSLGIYSIKMDGDFLEVSVATKNLDSDFFAGKSALMGRLKISDKYVSRSSGYFPLYCDAAGESGGSGDGGGTATDTHDYVDLGLSVKWATCNVGASKPEEYGKYFACGDVVGQTWNGSSWSGGGFSSYPEYELDANGNLGAEYDAAYAGWGGKWRMPTKAEWTELQENCSWSWGTFNKVSGYVIFSKKSGYTSNFIFLPAAGCGSYSSLCDAGSYGYYWSSTFSSGYTWSLYFYSGIVGAYGNYRYHGFPVRPVTE